MWLIITLTKWFGKKTPRSLVDYTIINILYAEVITEFARQIIIIIELCERSMIKNMCKNEVNIQKVPTG
jgi:hypothetical protein